MDSKPKTEGWKSGFMALVASAMLAYGGGGLQPKWWLVWFAAVPVVVIAARVKAWPAVLIAFGAWALGGLNLWAYLSDVIGVPLVVRLVVILVPAVQFALAVWLWRRQIVRGAVWRALLTLPCCWVTAEFLLVRTSPHGTFGSPAYTQMDCLPLVQLAAVTGLHGVSFVVFLTASAFGVMLAPAIGRREKWRIGVGVAALLIGVGGWGAWRLRTPAPEAGAVMIGLAATSDGRRLYPRDRATALGLLHDIFRSYRQACVVRG